MTMEENHKGQMCLFKTLLCQEGFCTECQICRDFLGMNEMKGTYNVILKAPNYIDEALLTHQNWNKVENLVTILTPKIKSALEAGARIEIERADISKKY